MRTRHPSVANVTCKSLILSQHFGSRIHDFTVVYLHRHPFLASNPTARDLHNYLPPCHPKNFVPNAKTQGSIKCNLRGTCSQEAVQDPVGVGAPYLHNFQNRWLCCVWNSLTLLANSSEEARSPQIAQRLGTSTTRSYETNDGPTLCPLLSDDVTIPGSYLNFIYSNHWLKAFENWTDIFSHYSGASNSGPSPVQQNLKKLFDGYRGKVAARASYHVTNKTQKMRPPNQTRSAPMELCNICKTCT